MAMTATGLSGFAAQAADTQTALKPPALSTATPPLAQIKQSVDYLRNAYGVTQSQAIRRLILQRNMPAISSWLQDRFPNDYAGMWLDQDHGGVAVVAATHPRTLAAALAALAGTLRLRTQTVRFSGRELQQAAVQARHALGPATDVTLDAFENQVVVRFHGQAATTRALAAARSSMPAQLRAGIIRITSFSGGYSNECDPATCTPPRTSGCDKTNCTPPLRAGTNIDLWTDISSSKLPEGRCTTGFAVNGSNGWVYSTTAGHCLFGAANVTSNNGHWVGYWTGGSYFSDTYPYDHAVTPFLVIGSTNYATYWFGGHRNYVISGSNTTFPITGMYTYSQIQKGWVVCASGTMTGTTCGSVINKDGGIVTNICQHHGDSGAPLFSQIDNKAYGLSIKDTTADDSCPSGYNSSFTPLSNVVGTQSDGVTLSVATN
jgi:streptogrisin C